MSTVVTLDSIRAAAEAKFGSTVIDLGDQQVELLNPIRLGKAKRERLSAISDDLKAEGADQEAILSDVLRGVAKTPAQGDALVEAIGGDFAVLLSVFNAYTTETQMGEASPSEN